MSAPRQLPARDRPGRQAWLGPLSMLLGVLSWLIFPASTVLALGAAICGIGSMATRGEYRIDWVAAAGTSLGAAQLLVSGLLFVMTASGH